MKRRRFLENFSLATLSMTIPSCDQTEKDNVPSFIKAFKKLYVSDPRNAALQWFQDAKFGLFIHYGLYSLTGKHPFLQFNELIPVKEYEKLTTQFTASSFDVDFITDLAIDAEMKYINLVTKHCEGFCLWDTKQTDFNSINSASKRDLVAEMAQACQKKGLGLFLFYEHGFDWRHPHGPRHRDFPTKITEVPYDPPESTYASRENYTLNHYVDFAAAQITELLTNYGPIAGIWLDGVAVPLSGDHSQFKLQELYDLIHRLQSQALVSYKFGVTGSEDFLAPEYIQLDRVKFDKPTEICFPLNKGWGYVEGQKHANIDEVWEQLSFARKHKASFLLNIGPLGDGSVYPQDIKTLKEMGKRIRQYGFPE